MSTSYLEQLLSRRHFVIGSGALAAAAFSGGLWGCASGEPLGSTGTPVSPEQSIADIVLHNGHVQTMVSEGDVASAVAIAGNKIVYVGDDSGIDASWGTLLKSSTSMASSSPLASWTATSTPLATGTPASTKSI